MTAGISIGLGVHVVLNTPTVSATPNYADGDNMGGLISLTDIYGPETAGQGGGLIQSVLISDAALNGLQIDAWFFDANPSSSTFTDNAAMSIHASDVNKVIGRVPVTDWDRSSQFGFAENLAMPFVTAANILYMALEARGAHNLAATTDIDVQVGIILERHGAVVPG